MLQQDEPEDYCIATGTQYSVRDFVNIVASELKINLQWEGTGINEKGIDVSNGKIIVSVDSKYFRPTEVETLLGDASKAKDKLGWEPKTTFIEMVKEMAISDFEAAEKESFFRDKLIKTRK
jgi:GDPmannose 4,6-dehydratase